MTGRTQTERILDAYLAPETDRLPDRVIDAALADIARTPQRRALRVPWRFTLMTSSMRAAAGIAIVAIVGVGVLALNLRSPGSGATDTPVPTPTAAPTPSPAPSQVALGITAWIDYTSAVYGFALGYPDDWSVEAAATRAWEAGDPFPAVAWPFADVLASAGNGDAQVGVWVWEMPAGEGADVESVPGLTAWAEAFCSEIGWPTCESFTQEAEPMCLNEGGDSCRSAILVPTAEGPFAFFVDWPSALMTSSPDMVRVVTVGREDSHPSTARYGGSVQLLKSILTTMNVWTPGPGQIP